MEFNFTCQYWKDKVKTVSDDTFDVFRCEYNSLIPDPNLLNNRAFSIIEMA